MRLPRRMPWTCMSELDQVCAWIYADEHDLDAKLLAIHRLSAWKAITPLPQALESTLSLLAVLQEDGSVIGSSFNHLSLRQSYAAAIIRLVNGLVDPLQLGAYARSVASIAAQLGLPAWLVELRHAATHEDLPSLEVLREAVRQSMAWLLHNYFLPTINPASAPQREPLPLRPLGPVLKQYKTVLKTVTRDASLRTRYKQEINMITRDIARWISEAKVAANVIVGEVGWDASEKIAEETREVNRDNNIDVKEKWALERFCDALLEKGGLVPLSKKKRVFPEEKFWPPQLSVSLWTPLLKHIQVLHASFACTLCAHILCHLLPPDATAHHTSQSMVENRKDPSSDMCLARWIMWCLDTWSNSSSVSQEETNAELRKDVIISLMQGLGYRMSDHRSKDTEAANALLQAICSRNLEYATVADFLSKPSNYFQSQDWTYHDMTIMTDRLTQLQSTATSQATDSLRSCDKLTPISSAPGPSVAMEVEQTDQLPIGWRNVDSVRWKPCPIGVFQRA